METKGKEGNRYLAAGFLLLFCLCQYGLGHLFGFSLFPDEFGYWAPAAEALGWDWSEITALGSYYSFGYSLLLRPVLFLFSGTAAYRAAVCGNAVLLALGLWLLYRLLRGLYGRLDREGAALLAGIGMLYPSCVFYMQTTLTESLLFFLYLLCCFLLFRFLENPGPAWGLGLAAALAYLYAVHMRGIGTLAAACLTLFVWAFCTGEKRRRKQMLLSLLALGVLFAAGGLGKELVIGRLYAGASRETLGINDYSGQWEKVGRLFSGTGLLAFFYSLAGKLLYLGISSFGLAFRGLFYAGKRSLCLARRRGKGNARDFFWLFVLLSSLFQVLISAVYTIGGADAGENKMDTLLYGRYSELIVPLLTAAGLRALLRERHPLRSLSLQTAVTALLALCCMPAAVQGRFDHARGYFIVGMSYLLREDSFHPVKFLWTAWAFGTVICVLVSVLGALWRRWGKAWWTLLPLLALQAALGLQASGHYLYACNRYTYQDLRAADRLEEVLEEKGGQTPVIHLYGGGTPYVELLQFQLREKKIQVWDVSDPAGGTAARVPGELTGEEIVVMREAGEEPFREVLEERYRTRYASGHLCLYYNPAGP